MIGDWVSFVSRVVVFWTFLVLVLVVVLISFVFLIFRRRSVLSLGLYVLMISIGRYRVKR